MASKTRLSEFGMYHTITLKHGLQLWIRHGIKANTRWTVTNMLRTISNYTGKTYKRSKKGQEEALADIIVVIEGSKQHERTL
jgi:hypothetical protein